MMSVKIWTENESARRHRSALGVTDLHGKRGPGGGEEGTRRRTESQEKTRRAPPAQQQKGAWARPQCLLSGPSQNPQDYHTPQLLRALFLRNISLLQHTVPLWQGAPGMQRCKIACTGILCSTFCLAPGYQRPSVHHIPNGRERTPRRSSRRTNPPPPCI